MDNKNMIRIIGAFYNYMETLMAEKSKTIYIGGLPYEVSDFLGYSISKVWREDDSVCILVDFIGPGFMGRTALKDCSFKRQQFILNEESGKVFISPNILSDAHSNARQTALEIPLEGDGALKDAAELVASRMDAFLADQSNHLQQGQSFIPVDHINAYSMEQIFCNPDEILFFIKFSCDGSWGDRIMKICRMSGSDGELAFIQ